MLTTSLPTQPSASPTPRWLGRWRIDPLYEAIVWLVVLPLLPWVIYERGRRWLGRRTEAGARRERAAEAALRKLNSTPHERDGGRHS
jgi:hypothetical protein